jgi:tetratricopeptide (TPR) repeat protein
MSFASKASCARSLLYKALVFLGLNCLVVPALFADWKTHREQGDTAMQSQDYKSAIDQYQTAFMEVPQQQRCDLSLKLARAYYRDQEHERAFKIYLDVLDLAAPTSASKTNAEEQELYEKALAVYSGAATLSVQQMSEQLTEKYAQVMADHPNYHLLGFMLAASYANLGMYEQFFDRFYESYQHYPDHFMVYKTRGVLQLKLMESARSWEDKAKYREAALTNFVNALERYSEDITLYRLIVSLAQDAQKPQLVVTTLQRLMDLEIEIPRSDICPYVQLAMTCEDEALAEKLVLRAEKLYAYSRAVKVARDYLEQHRKRD